MKTKNQILDEVKELAEKARLALVEVKTALEQLQSLDFDEVLYEQGVFIVPQLSEEDQVTVMIDLHEIQIETQECE